VRYSNAPQCRELSCVKSNRPAHQHQPRFALHTAFFAYFAFNKRVAITATYFILKHSIQTQELQISREITHSQKYSQQMVLRGPPVLQTSKPKPKPLIYPFRSLEFNVKKEKEAAQLLLKISFIFLFLIIMDNLKFYVK
jgi:hypothetical protein